MSRFKKHRTAFSHGRDFPDWFESARTSDLTQDQFEDTIPRSGGQITSRQSDIIDDFAKKNIFKRPTGVTKVTYKNRITGKIFSSNRATQNVTVGGKSYKKGQFVGGRYKD